MTQALFIIGMAVLIAIGFAAVAIAAACIVDVLLFFRRTPEELPDPDVVVQLRPLGNVDRVDEQGGP